MNETVSKMENVGDAISRQAALDAIRAISDHGDSARANALGLAEHAVENLPTVQPEGWMERNKERILQAGMERREIEFRIGGRLFAIREKAQ